MDFKNETGPENVVTIKVIGVGGAGNNVVNRMVKSGTQGVQFVAINTDKQALAVSNADVKIQIGEKITKGQGAGSDPEVGKRAAEESRNNIQKAVEGSDMVFITAGEGGGTGTGAAPQVAEIAKEAGVLTVGVVTKPFKFEGKRRMDQANSGIKELLSKVDSLLIIPNDRLKFATDQKITLANAFEIADDVLQQAVSSISELIKNTGFINLDFADVSCIMKNAGFAHMGVGHASGKAKAEDAAKLAVASPLMETSINGARGVLINITGSEDMSLDDIEAAANLVQEAAHPDANIIFGASFDSTMQDEIRVTVIATGFSETSQSSTTTTTSSYVDNFLPSVSKSSSNPSTTLPIFTAPNVEKLDLPLMEQQPEDKKADLSSEPFSNPVQNIKDDLPVYSKQDANVVDNLSSEPEPKHEEDPFDNIFKLFNTK